MTCLRQTGLSEYKRNKFEINGSCTVNLVAFPRVALLDLIYLSDDFAGFTPERLHGSIHLFLFYEFP